MGKTRPIYTVEFITAKLDRARRMRTISIFVLIITALLTFVGGAVAVPKGVFVGLLIATLVSLVSALHFTSRTSNLELALMLKVQQQIFGP